MGLTFDNPNNLQKMLDRFASVPDPKKTPKHGKPSDLLPKRDGSGSNQAMDKEKDPEVKSKKKKDKK